MIIQFDVSGDNLTRLQAAITSKLGADEPATLQQSRQFIISMLIDFVRQYEREEVRRQTQDPAPIVVT